jgi:DNA-binding MarR family transcriptional regulator
MQQPINSDSSFFLLLDIARMLRARFELAVRDAALGITPSEARTLANIARFGPINQNDLADLSGFGAMSAARVLKSLETAGLVSRSTAPNDRRIKMVQITEQAKPLLAAVKNIGDGRRKHHTRKHVIAKLEPFAKHVGDCTRQSFNCLS